MDIEKRRENHNIIMKRYRAKKTDAYVNCQKGCYARYMKTEGGREARKNAVRSWNQRQKEYVLWMRDFNSF